MIHTFQAKDIPDVVMLSAVLEINAPHDTCNPYKTHCDRGHPATVWNLLPQYANKVVNAKLRQLKKRGMVDGCPCGCRGDWTLTQKGIDYVRNGEVSGLRGADGVTPGSEWKVAESLS